MEATNPLVPMHRCWLQECCGDEASAADRIDASNPGVAKNTARGPNPAHEGFSSGPRSPFLLIAKQMSSAVLPSQSHFDPINLIANSIIGDNERDDDLFFGDHLFFWQHNKISNVIYRYSQVNLS